MSLTGLLLQLILFPWQLPQNLLGLGFGLYLRCRGRIAEMKWERNRCFLRTDTAVSLALFIFWKIDYDDPVFFLPSVNREHEYGHSIQSLLLGPLYLPVVGLPSYLRTVYARWYYQKHGVRWEGYYAGFPESWADRLGGVDSLKDIRLPR